jgi:hypothetical protein
MKVVTGVTRKLWQQTQKSACDLRAMGCASLIFGKGQEACTFFLFLTYIQLSQVENITWYTLCNKTQALKIFKVQNQK